MLAKLARRIYKAEQLDGIVEPLADAANRVLPPGGVKDLLHGKQLGHALHPMLVAAPIGFNIGASLLDLVPGERAGVREGAQRLTGAALLATVPTVLAGLADWSSLGANIGEKRVGLVHAGANTFATTFYLASWLARRSGRHGLGATLSLIGGGGLVVGGYLGGHLAYVNAVGVNRNADAQPEPADWTDAAPATDLDQGPIRVDLEGQAIVVVRDTFGVHALGAVCSHLGGPLDEGELTDGCLVCPWHGSEFDVTTGAVVRGPATVPQPRYEARIEDGRVQVRARE